MVILYIYTNFVNLVLCNYHILPKMGMRKAPLLERRFLMGICYLNAADCMAAVTPCTSSPGRSSRHMMISRPSYSV